jgi:D-serine deaminase-like pyridoxal phosphate-dependent protein
MLEEFCSAQISAASDSEAMVLAVRRLGVWVSVDAGYGREGALAHGAVEICAALHSSRRLRLAGLYCHSGNSYNCPGCPSEARAAAQSLAVVEATVVSTLAADLAAQGIHTPAISIGATPSLMAGSVWSTAAIDAALSILPSTTELELHAGNYPFLDRQQVASGSAGMEDIAVYVLARIIGVYPDRNGGEFLIDAGGCALHKDSGGLDTWGCLAEDHSVVLRKMTQEVSVVGRAKGDATPIDYSRYIIGSLVRVLPNHSCMTAACHDYYVTVIGPGPGTLQDANGGVIQVTGRITPCKYW